MKLEPYDFTKRHDEREHIMCLPKTALNIPILFAFGIPILFDPNSVSCTAPMFIITHMIDTFQPR